MVGSDDTPDGPKWTAQSEGPRALMKGLKINTWAVPIKAAQRAVGE